MSLCELTDSQTEAFHPSFSLFLLGLREDEEPRERHRVHLAQGEVFEPPLSHEGDVQQLRRGRRMGRARGVLQTIL